MRQIKLPDADVPLQPLNDEFLRARNVRVAVLRLDLLHPYVSGNKWFKLRFSLEDAWRQGRRTLLSFGGAYSNHLLALAAAGHEFGFATVGLVRGEVRQPLNPVLRAAQAFGMRLVPVTRSDYRNKHLPDYQYALREAWGDAYIIPEGGATLAGARGCMAIAEMLRWPHEPSAARIVTLATATGTTLAGLVAGLGPEVRVDATLVLKGEDRCSVQVQAWLWQLAGQRPALSHASWQVVEGWHAGGYARATPALLAFIDDFVARTGIALEPVYTGKMMWSLYGRIASGEIPEGAAVIAIHTGGIAPPAD